MNFLQLKYFWIFFHRYLQWLILMFKDFRNTQYRRVSSLLFKFFDQYHAAKLWILLKVPLIICKVLYFEAKFHFIGYLYIWTYIMWLASLLIVRRVGRKAIDSREMSFYGRIVKTTLRKADYQRLRGNTIAAVILMP